MSAELDEKIIKVICDSWASPPTGSMPEAKFIEIWAPTASTRSS